MEKQKGQVEIIVLVIAVIAAIIFFNFFKPGSKTSPGTTPTNQPKQESPAATPPASYTNPGPDTTAPLRLNVQPSGGLAAGTRQVYLSLDTNENAMCRYATVSGFFYEYMPYTFSVTGAKYHTTLITALSDGGFYNYYIRCLDSWGNKNTDDLLVNFYVSMPRDYTPPVISHPFPNNETLPNYTREVQISVSTNEPATCRYSLSQGTSYDYMSSTFSQDTTWQYHTITVRNLGMGGFYEYFVRCKDTAGNVNTGDVMIRFNVAP